MPCDSPALFLCVSDYLIFLLVIFSCQTVLLMLLRHGSSFCKPMMHQIPALSKTSRAQSLSNRLSLA